ncbi:MAG: hypothetical protein ABFR53_03090 [Actinomycetota bacterium]
MTEDEGKRLINMSARRVEFIPLAVKTIVVHTVTYFVMGLLALTLLNYGSWFAESDLSSFMRQIDDPLVMSGPLFQPIRGLLFAVVFYLLRDVLFGRKNGWMVMWVLLVVIGVLSTFGPSPGSIEGMIYTILPFWEHLRGWPEVVVQALAFSSILTYWVQHPEKRWLTRTLAAAFVLVLLLPAMGLLFT